MLNVDYHIDTTVLLLYVDKRSYTLVVMEVADENIQRFTVELEFVQCLANPEYLN